MSGRACLCAIAAAAVLSGCVPERPPALLWSRDPEIYFSESDFAAGVYSKSVVLVARAHDRPRHELVALDPQTGAERWRRSPAEWVLHPPGRATPLFLVNRTWEEDTAPAGDPAPFREVREIDPATGRDLRRIPLAKPIGSVGTRLVLAGGEMVYQEIGAIGAVDLATGAQRWEKRSESSGTFAPLALPDRVVLPEPAYVALALSDGHEISRTEGVCCTALASPDGAHTYIRTGTDEAGELLSDGRIGQRYAGAVEAVSERFVAIGTRRGAAALAVYEHGGTSPVWSATGRGEDDYFSAVALAGERLFFFRAADALVWMHNLATGRDLAIFSVSPKVVIGPDARGAGPAHVSTPPVYDAPLLFVHDWTVRAYRVED